MTNSLRPDLKIICDIVDSGSKVLDIGCGEGELLHALKTLKNVSGRGLEIDQEKVSKCLSRGISVTQGDVNTDLVHYPDHSFDYTILTQTLQVTKSPDKILQEALRIGKQTIVAVPNFGYWKNRWQLMLEGRMPVTKKLSYQWFETPNIHFCTIRDFVILCDDLGLEIKKKLAINSANKIMIFSGSGGIANIFGEQGIFLLSR